MLLKYILLIIFSSCSLSVYSQNFLKGEQFTISSSLVLQENYSTIIMTTGSVNNDKINQFEQTNKDTRLQVITDSYGNRYHILLQLNFWGQITYLAISNNLNELFNKKEKPPFIFNQCIKQLNYFNSSQQNIEAAIKCIMDRLEYCSIN